MCVSNLSLEKGGYSCSVILSAQQQQEQAKYNYPNGRPFTHIFQFAFYQRALCFVYYVGDALGFFFVVAVSFCEFRCKYICILYVHTNQIMECNGKIKTQQQCVKEGSVPKKKKWMYIYIIYTCRCRARSRPSSCVYARVNFDTTIEFCSTLSHISNTVKLMEHIYLQTDQKQIHNLNFCVIFWKEKKNESNKKNQSVCAHND